MSEAQTVQKVDEKPHDKFWIEEKHLQLKGINVH